MMVLNQLLRYGLVGIASNAVLYFVYLALTYGGLGHKSAATLCFGIGALQTFVFNKRWSFCHTSRYEGPLLRYVAVYALGYGLNLAGLYTLVDRAGYPHQAVQGMLVLVIALLMFVLSKHWVFVERAPRKGPT
jgi:putative flippase GtrA